MYNKFFLLIIICAWSAIGGHAQKFNGSGRSLQDYNGTYFQQQFNIQVYDLPAKMDTSFGLENVCINIQHPRVSDLKITLESPDGTSIWLTNRNGRDTGKNYVNTCFRATGKNGYIHESLAPFTGEFIPDGRMEYFNNGQNPNGYWKLIVEDLKEGMAVELDYCSLKVGKHAERFKIKKSFNL